MKSQRGFAPLALLGSPWTWLLISAALLSLTGWQLWSSWHREARVRGELAAFTEQVKKNASWDAGRRREKGQGTR